MIDHSSDDTGAEPCGDLWTDNFSNTQGQCAEATEMEFNANRLPFPPVWTRKATFQVHETAASRARQLQRPCPWLFLGPEY